MKIVEYTVKMRRWEIETHEEARILSVRYVPSSDRVLVSALVDETRPKQFRVIRVVDINEVVQGLSSAIHVGSFSYYDGSVDGLTLHAFDFGPCAAPGEDLREEEEEQ